MTFIVAALGMTVAVLGIMGFIQPSSLVELLEEAWRTRRALQIAVGFRVVFGVALLASAAGSHFPTTFTILGALSLVAAVSVPFLGSERLERLMRWWVDRPEWVLRAWSLVAILFGAFVVYGVV